MSAPPFVHLHCHSHFSLLDGASPIGGLVDRAKSLGMNALALTDHGNLYGALDFYRTARAAGINPIIGYEAYIAPGSRFQKDAGGMKEASYHLTLLAQNKTGFRNLIKLSSQAFLEGFYFKPRIDKEILEAHSEGLICLSGCVSGEFSRAILQQHGDLPDLAAAMQTAAWFHKVFGERYFIEIQNNGLEIQQIAMQGAVEVAKRMGLPLVATSDAHYVNREDAEAQDVLLCINTGKFRTDKQRMRMEGDQFFLRSAAEMHAAMSEHEEALRQSQLIADSVDIQLDLGKRHFPTYKLPEQRTAQDYLYELCVKGLKERYADDPQRLIDGELAPAVVERLEFELSVINKLEFANYFLIVWDFVRHARERDIPATARGSGVGSVVSYALYLSHVCPLKYDLLFERFLDENRKEAPDIDIDFCKDRRADVITYVKEKYGEANVAQIGTFGTLAARAAIRDVGRALGWPIPRVDALVALVPQELHITIEKAIESSPDLKKIHDTDPDSRELLGLAKKIEGLARNVGTHAAAVVIADQPLVEYVPLGRVQGKEEVITQWAMGDVEAAGLLKMDFLGLGNLTTLAKAVELIKQTTGIKVDPYKFPLDDRDTFALLCRGETKGIFQLESGGIRDLLQKMKPDHFRDIIATNALYRPGPLEGGMVDDYVQVKHGRKPAQYPHPVMKDVLEETHGVMVYQEQVMRILNRLGGIALSDAYSCIKAISKKKLPVIAKYREQFVDGTMAKGLDRKQAVELFEMIEKFAGYGFNKSHSTAYALIAYMTAYLKAHYPVEFMAALLSGDIDGRNFKKKDGLVEHLEDCRRMAIEVVPPDVNRSAADFTVADGKISFGLCAIKGCGGAAAAALVAARTSGGPFRDLFDFCERVDPTQLGRATIETLIKAGAFDSFGPRRSQHTAVLERAMQSGAALHADRRSGQKGLFDSLDEPPEQTARTAAAAMPDLREWDERERLTAEKEVLGFYLSSHPLAEHEKTLATYCSHSTTDLGQLPHRTEVVVGGMLSSIKISQSKNPRPGASGKYAMFDLEDIAGSLRCILWSEGFEQFGHLVRADATLVIRGVVDRRPGTEETNLIVNELIPLDQLDGRFTKGIVVRIDQQQHGEEGLSGLYEVLRGYPGKCELQLVVCLDDGSRVFLKSDSMRIDLNAEMRSRVDGLLGPGNLRLIPAPMTRPSPPRNHGASRALVKG
jgi:DNA polymerase-3 subunit alpha